MTQILSGGIEALRAAMRGPVFTADDAEYDRARRVWNADTDRRPAVIARCASARDVSAAVGFAVDAGLEIAVRGGGHSMSGQSTVDDGLMIDLSALNQVSVDPGARRARVGGGALLADLDAATQAHGLAVPAGIVGHTGVGGLTLGGGMGWLTRQAGLTIDNLESVEIVVADGRILRSSAEQNPDLFWAIRGGGGNFGVVTEFEFRLHEVGPLVQLGFFFWGLDQGAEALRTIRAVVADLPRSQGAITFVLDAPPAPFVPEPYHLRTGVALMLVGFGGVEEHERATARIRAALPPPPVDHVTPIPYVALQQMFDEESAWGQYYYEKSTYIEEITDGVIEVLLEQAPRRTSSNSFVELYRLDQRFSEVGEDDTAYGGSRSPQYGLFTIAACESAEQLAADRGWARTLWDLLQSHSLGIGTYVNGLAEQDDRRILASYGQAKYERLARIKAVYDPGNVFHRNANIKPQ